MILVDSAVFVLDLFYPTDPRAPVNRAFLESDSLNIATTVFNVLEICGNASFNKTSEALERVFTKIRSKTNFSDALILATGEPFRPSTFVTWNVKHFAGRTSMRVATPGDVMGE